MGFWSRLFGGERRSLSASSLHPRDPVLADMWSDSSRTAAGAAVTPDSALRCPAVYACVGLLADTIGTIPLDLFERTGPDAARRATGHPMHALLHDAPNAWQTSAEFRQMMVEHLCTHGNAYAEIVWRGDGMAEALEPLHPGQVMPFRRPSGGHAYRYQPTDGPARILLPAEVLHLRRRPFERDGLRGKSPVLEHRETIGRAMAQAEYLSRFFGNSAVPKGGIEVPTAISDKAADLLRESFERRHRGAENAHRVAIFDGGMKYVPMGASNQDSQAVEAYRDTVAEIASRIYGLPPHLVGETDRSTSWGSGIEQQSIGFVVFFVRPWLVLWEQALNRALLSAAGRQRYYYEFNADGLMRGDFKSRLEGLALMIQWGLATPNEARRLLNMAPLEGGDSRLQPLNMAPAERVMDILLRDPGKAQRALLLLSGPEVPGGPFEQRAVKRYPKGHPKGGQFMPGGGGEDGHGRRKAAIRQARQAMKRALRGKDQVDAIAVAGIPHRVSLLVGDPGALDQKKGKYVNGWGVRHLVSQRDASHKDGQRVALRVATALAVGKATVLRQTPRDRLWRVEHKGWVAIIAEGRRADAWLLTGYSEK